MEVTLMDRATENKLKVSLTEKLREWWDEVDTDMPLIGDNVLEIMATAALSVLLAVDDTQDFLYHENMLKRE